MKRIAFILLLSIVSFSCTKKTSNQSSKLLPREAFKDSLSKPEVQVVDLRTAEQHEEEGSFDKAKNIDYEKENFQDIMQENFDKSQPIYIHCKGGIKSEKAAKELEELGFEKIYELKGGFDDWSEKQQETFKAENN